MTPQPRPYAATLEERGFVYQPTEIKGNKPIPIGHQYSTVALLPEKDGEYPAPWVLPLSVKRVSITEKKALVGATQMDALLGNKALPFARQFCVEVGDSDYSQPAYMVANRKYDHLVTLVRSRGNRVYYRQASGTSSGGAFRLREPETWQQPPMQKPPCPFPAVEASGVRFRSRPATICSCRGR